MLRYDRVVVAVEHERVEAGLALDYVTAIAVVPDERVVAGAEERRVGAFAADDRVVAGPPSRMSLPSPPLRVSLPLPPNRCAAGSVVAPRRALRCERDRVVAVPAEHLDFGGVGERRLAP